MPPDTRRAGKPPRLRDAFLTAAVLGPMISGAAPGAFWGRAVFATAADFPAFFGFAPPLPAGRPKSLGLGWPSVAAGALGWGLGTVGFGLGF